MNKKRLAGIEKEMSRVIAQVLFEEVKNPKLKCMISVTRIKVTEDLKFADVYFSLLAYNGEELNIKAVEEALNEVKRFLRKRCGEELSIRYVPEIRVKIDDSIEKEKKISKILNDIK